MPVTKFPSCFAKDHFGSLVSSGGFSKKPTAQIGDFRLGKKRREKTRMDKVVKSCHQVTWAQKSVTKECEFLILKSVKMNSYVA